MSIEASKWAWEQTGLSSAEKLVLLCLADHADERGENCWPSQERVAKKSGVARDTVGRSIRRFATLAARDIDGKTVVGIIETIKTPIPGMGALTFNLYKLLLDRTTLDRMGETNSRGGKTTNSRSRATSTQPPCDIDAVAFAPSAVSIPSGENQNIVDNQEFETLAEVENVTNSRFPYDDRSPDPSEDNHHKEKKERERAQEDQIPQDLGLGADHPGHLAGFELWTQLETFWRSEGKRLGLYQIALYGKRLAQLKEQGADPVAVCETALRRGWKDLFAPDEPNKPPGEEFDAAAAAARIKAIAEGEIIT